MLGYPERADPEIAAATFWDHLDALWGGPAPTELGLTREKVDDLHSLIGLTAVRNTGHSDQYFVLLGAEFYDRWPPTAAFVEPQNRQPAPANSRWWPTVSPNPPWGALHNSYTFQLDGQTGQMLCFTFTAEYYRAQHSPPEYSVWKQGRHTVSATITRIAEILRQPYYRGPSA